MRPLITAEPMLRAPSPEMAAASKRTAGGSAACRVPVSRPAVHPSARKVFMMAPPLPGLRGGEDEEGVVRRRVYFDLLDRELLVLGSPFRPRFGGKGDIDAGDLLIVAQIGLDVLLRPTNHAPGRRPDLEEVLGIEVVVLQIPVLEHNLELVRLRSVHVLGAELFHLV